MLLLLTLLAPFAGALMAPALARVLGTRTGYVLALIPAGAFATYLSLVPESLTAHPFEESLCWFPSLDIALHFRADPLSLLFALIISGIGTLIVLYAQGYLEDHPALGRFYASLMAFMGAMLGVVLSDNLLAMFVFWELTSLASYFLIGFYHETASSRRAALQALVITGLGGLALLAGIVMIGHIAGTYNISELEADTLHAHALYPALVLLVLLGTLTKSAQFPFHFWLPNAMEAPAPVSAYLHSATMVKAGVFLMAKLNPALGGTLLWQETLLLAGGTTMLWGAFTALRKNDLKQILAWTTVSILGTLTFLIGLGHREALQAMILLVIAHALYKGALFMVAGGVDHAVQERDIAKLGGLRRALPWTATAAVLAGLSMVGLPPALGFPVKELLLESALLSPLGYLPVVAIALSAALMAAAALNLVWRTFWGPTPRYAHAPHENRWPLLVGPLLLGLLGMVLPLAFPQAITGLAAAAIAQTSTLPGTLKLSWWHGLDYTPLHVSLGILLGALLLVRLRLGLTRLPLHLPQADPLYDQILKALMHTATATAAFIQNGKLRTYILTTILTMCLLTGYQFLTDNITYDFSRIAEVRPHEFGAAALMILATLMACVSDSRIGAMITLGCVGIGITLIFLFFSAPDLAMTQILVETLTVILFVLVFFRLPRFTKLSSAMHRTRDALVATLAGVLVAAITLTTAQSTLQETISGYFAENSYTLAHGRNVVNVILVDFRALDTLGEIIVLAMAAIGVFAMIRLRPRKKPPHP